MTDSYAYWHNVDWSGRRGSTRPQRSSNVDLARVVVSDDWLRWANGIIANDGTDPARAARARQRLADLE